MSYRISEEASKTDTAPLALSLFFFRARNEFDVPATLMKFDSAWNTVSLIQNGTTGAYRIGKD